MKMKKTLTLILALVLIASLTVGGTLAYFKWNSNSQVNQFQVSGTGVEIEIDPGKDQIPGNEDDTIEPGWDPSVDHPITPDVTYTKDPQVTVTGLECYVYFKVEEVNNYWDIDGDGQADDRIVEWAARNGWINITEQVTGAKDNCWYFAWNTSVAGAAYDDDESTTTNPTLYLFTDGDLDTTKTTYESNGEVHISAALTEDQVEAIAESLVLETDADGNKTYDTIDLIITAYAVQVEAAGDVTDTTPGAAQVAAFNTAAAESTTDTFAP